MTDTNTALPAAGPFVPPPASPISPSAPQNNGKINILRDLERDLNGDKSFRRTAGPATRPATEPREASIAKMAGAGITSIAESIIRDTEKQMVEVRALADAVEQEGRALIESIRRGAETVERRIREFSELQESVRAAFLQANNQVATFTGDV